MFQLLFIILHNILQVTGHENIINFPVYSTYWCVVFFKGFFCLKQLPLKQVRTYLSNLYGQEEILSEIHTFYCNQH